LVLRRRAWYRLLYGAARVDVASSATSSRFGSAIPALIPELIAGERRCGRWGSPVTLLLAVLAATTSIPPPPAVARLPPVAFGSPGNWALVARDGTLVDRFKGVGDKVALEVAVSPDASVIAVVRAS
jgi:hypothetical protein